MADLGKAEIDGFAGRFGNVLSKGFTPIPFFKPVSMVLGNDGD